MKDLSNKKCFITGAASGIGKASRSSGDADDVPGVLKPVRVSVDYITFEYGLYDQRPLFAFETSVPGIFAAGDVRCGSTNQIAAAVGEGAAAALSIRDFLKTV